MAQQHRQCPDRAAHAISPGVQMDLPVERGGQILHYASPSGSRSRFARQGRAPAPALRPRSLRRDFRWAHRQAAAAASPPARGRSQRVVVVRRTIARDNDAASCQAPAAPPARPAMPHRDGRQCGTGKRGCPSTFRLGIRLNCWNTRPSRSRRNAARSASGKSETLNSPSLISPLSAESRPAIRCKQRALAAAGFAGQRDAFARRDTQIDPAQHRDLFAGRAIALGQVADAQHWRVAGCHAKRASGLTSASGTSARIRRPAPAA